MKFNYNWVILWLKKNKKPVTGFYFPDLKFCFCKLYANAMHVCEKYTSGKKLWYCEGDGQGCFPCIFLIFKYFYLLKQALKIIIKSFN